jgi:hypothetical protein
MNEVALSLACVTLLVASSTTGALAASTIAVNHGSSMEPTLCDGAILHVDRDATPEIGDVVGAHVSGSSGLTYHRVVRRAPDWDEGPNGQPVRDDGRDYVLSGDGNGDHVDVDRVWHDPHRVDYTDREQIVGVLDRVLYDGCGPV